MRRSLRPRSAMTRCLTLPPSRRASTTRTYSWMVPLEERTRTVLGYMRTIIMTFFGMIKKISGRNRVIRNSVVTTLFGPEEGRPRLMAWKTRRFRSRRPPTRVVSPQTWGSDRPGETDGEDDPMADQATLAGKVALVTG